MHLKQYFTNAFSERTAGQRQKELTVVCPMTVRKEKTGMEV